MIRITLFPILITHLVYLFYRLLIYCIVQYVFSADLSENNQKNSLGGSFNQSDILSDDDDSVFANGKHHIHNQVPVHVHGAQGHHSADSSSPVLDEEIESDKQATELQNIRRILNECRVLYKSKVDHHNRKVFTFITL